MRSTLWVCLLFLLVLASPALSQNEPAEAPAPVLQGEILIDEAYGFSVESPGPDWKWAETENPQGRSFTVESPDGAHLLFVAAADEPLPQGKGDFMKGYVTGLREPLEKTVGIVMGICWILNKKQEAAVAKQSVETFS